MYRHWGYKKQASKNRNNHLTTERLCMLTAFKKTRLSCHDDWEPAELLVLFAAVLYKPSVLPSCWLFSGCALNVKAEIREAFDSCNLCTRLYSLSRCLSLSMINQSKCDNCTDLWRTGKITSTQTKNKIGTKKQKILLYCFLQFFVWQNLMHLVCLFFYLLPITNIFSFKTAGNREVSYVFLVTFVTEKSGAIRPGCFGWRPCHPSWRPGGKWLM